jgi:hypothetical protein
VAIPAIPAHNFLCTRIHRFERELSSLVPAATAAHEDPASPRQFRLAQTLPLKQRFSSLPPFALIAAPALASVVAVFMTLEPYETATGWTSASCQSVPSTEIVSLPRSLFS